MRNRSSWAACTLINQMKNVPPLALSVPRTNEGTHSAFIIILHSIQTAFHLDAFFVLPRRAACFIFVSLLIVYKRSLFIAAILIIFSIHKGLALK